MNTITETCALNVLLQWLLQDFTPFNPVPSSEEAMEAAAKLAEKSRKTGAARYGPKEVRTLWKEKGL
jgi:hypothetical protein